MIELLAHIALAVGFFALGYVVRRAQEPEQATSPPVEIHGRWCGGLHYYDATGELIERQQARKVVGRRGGRELPEVEVRPWKGGLNG